MRKTVLAILCIMIFVTGCKSSTPERKEVVVNLPTDDSVNGYRQEDAVTPNIIPTDEVSISHKETISVSYCGNKNSKIFHKISCSSVKSMKEENKVYFATKEEFLENGYQTCKMCNP